MEFKIKTDHKRSVLNSWRTIIEKNWNTLYPEIIRTAQYVRDSSMLEVIQAIAEHLGKYPENFDPITRGN